MILHRLCTFLGCFSSGIWYFAGLLSEEVPEYKINQRDHILSIFHNLIKFYKFCFSKISKGWLEDPRCSRASCWWCLTPCSRRCSACTRWNRFLDTLCQRIAYGTLFPNRENIHRPEGLSQGHFDFLDAEQASKMTKCGLRRSPPASSSSCQWWPSSYLSWYHEGPIHIP